MSRNYSFCFVINNYSDQSIENVKGLKSVGYLIAGFEKAPTTGTPHIQGYVRFNNAKTISAVVKNLSRGGAPHPKVLIAGGDDTQNTVYCSKEGEVFVSIGKPKKPGERTDLQTIKAKILETGSMRGLILDDEISLNYQGIKYAEKIVEYCEPQRNAAPEVWWCYGKTGTGKTRWCFEQCSLPWISGRTLKWWQGYDAHEDVIIDDFRKDFCTFHELLRILDRYPYSIEYKGGSRQLLAKRIFITCPYPPDEVYSTREDVEQLLRRITHVKEFT